MANGLAARNGGRAGLAPWSRSSLLGLGLRVGYAWDGRAPVFDAAAYARDRREPRRRATASPSASAATQPASDYSPGLPLFVAGIYKVERWRPRTAGARSSSP